MRQVASKGLDSLQKRKADFISPTDCAPVPKLPDGSHQPFFPSSYNFFSLTFIFGCTSGKTVICSSCCLYPSFATDTVSIAERIRMPTSHDAEPYRQQSLTEQSLLGFPVFFLYLPVNAS